MNHFGLAANKKKVRALAIHMYQAKVINAHTGYSGVVTFCKEGFTLNAKAGIDIEEFDQEGRIMITDHHHFVLYNVYFPNGGRDGRVDFKMQFYNKFLDHVKSQSPKPVIILGDVNTAHQLLDVHHKKVPISVI
jgi:exodeoxyribonuclease III